MSENTEVDISPKKADKIGFFGTLRTLPIPIIIMLLFILLFFCCLLIGMIQSMGDGSNNYNSNLNEKDIEFNQDKIRDQEQEFLVEIKQYYNMSFEELRNKLPGGDYKELENNGYKFKTYKIEEEKYRLLFENNTSQTVKYIQIDLKEMSNCTADSSILNQSTKALRLAGINQDDLGEYERAPLTIGSVFYMNFDAKMVVGVSCDMNGELISVSYYEDDLPT